MQEAELRARFDAQVISPHKEVIWRHLERQRIVSDVRRGELSWEDLLNEALRLAGFGREIAGGTKPPGRSPRHQYADVEVRLTDSEAEHATALAPYLAKRAALLPEVQGFRKEKLDGGTLGLEHEQIATFLRRELRYLPSEWHEEVEWALEQIPSYPGRNEVEELMDLVGGHQNRGPRSEEEYWEENFRRHMEFDSLAMSYMPPQQFPYGLMHLIRDETGRTLEDVGRWLVARYPWPLRDAAWFVLTGGPPEVEPLRVEDNKASGTYSLTFARWVSEGTIRLAYRRLQSGDNRPLSRKTLSVFTLVNAYTEPGQTPRWAELTELWNAQHPDDKFSDRSGLRRAYKRAEARLAYAWKNESEPPARPGGMDAEELAFPKTWDPRRSYAPGAGNSETTSAKQQGSLFD